MWNAPQARGDLVGRVARRDVLLGAQAAARLDQRARVVADETGREQRALARGVVAARDRVPDVERRGEPGVRLLDRRAGRAGEDRDRLREALPHLAVEADVAEIVGGSHAQAREVARRAGGGGVVTAEGGQAERIARIGTGHHGKRAAAVGHGARERPEVREQEPAGAVGARGTSP